MKVWKSILVCLGSSAILVACADKQFSAIQKKGIEPTTVVVDPTTPPTDPTDVPTTPSCEGGDQDVFICFIIKDSFERASIQQNDQGIGFGWSSLIDDVTGANGDRVEAAIYNDNQLGVTPEAITGPETDEGRSLLFTGRPGGSVHSIFLVSEKFDLSNFNSVIIQFDYLPINLGWWNWGGSGGHENIRLEVCESDLQSCGVLPALSENGLNSNNWSIRYQSPSNAGRGLNGHNHVLNDWNTADVRLDISNFPQAIKENFVFRISVTIDQGFISGDINGNLEDGVALDNVLAMASQGSLDDDSFFTDPQGRIDTSDIQ